MAAIGSGWADGAWVQAGWVSGAWAGGAAPAAAPTPTGGFWFDYDREIYRRDQARKKLLALEEKTEQIEDSLEREIAEEYRKQESEQARIEELSMLSKIAAQHKADIEQSMNDRIKVAAQRATTQWNYSAMEALERELRRFKEEEDFLMMATEILLRQ